MSCVQDELQLKSNTSENNSLKKSSSDFTATKSDLVTKNFDEVTQNANDTSFALQDQQQQILECNKINEFRDWNKLLNSTTHKSDSTEATKFSNTPQKSSDESVCLMRRVSFPKSDNELVTGYLEPANPWEHAYMIRSISEITKLYEKSCQKHNTKPLQAILDHLKILELSKQSRQPILSLKSIHLKAGDCEALEEIFKRVQYKAVDLSSCNLDENSASALFEMIEYYEATNELDISSNSRGLTHRGWNSCSYMISRSQALQILNAHGNLLSKTSAENLGNSLCTSNLQILKLEHCGLKGIPLSGLCFKLRHNRVLRELWLGHNDLDSQDADVISDLLKVNFYIEFLDISNNNIKDEGLRHIVQALIFQSKEVERRSSFQRASAFDDDAASYALETTSSVNNNKIHVNDQNVIAETKFCNDFNKVSKNFFDKNNFEILEKAYLMNNTNILNKNVRMLPSNVLTLPMSSDISKEASNTSTFNVKNSSNVGQSMLHKLLSMNSNKKDENTTIVNRNVSTDYPLEESRIINNETFNSPIVKICKESTNLLLNSTTQDTNDCLNEQLLININPTDNTNCSSDEVVLVDCNSENNDDNTNHNKLSNHVDLLNKEDAQSEVNKVYTANNAYKPNEQLSSSLLLVNVSTVDSNKIPKVSEDCEDSHSTDSAFESASEGDLSRHFHEELPSLRSSGIEYIVRDPTIETAIVAAECLSEENNFITPTKLGDLCVTSLTTNSLNLINKQNLENTLSGNQSDVNMENNREDLSQKPFGKSNNNNNSISHTSKNVVCHENFSFEEKEICKCVSPLPLISPSSISLDMRCIESLNNSTIQSAKHCSQSSDSLCSDNSFDSSISSDLNFSTSSKINEKLTKNDTLNRQQRHIATSPKLNSKIPFGLKAFSVWNNNLTKEAGLYTSDLLAETSTLELLNIGKNCLSNEFITHIKDNLTKNSTLTTLGLQSAHLSHKGIAILSSILTFGGNMALQRIDIRDNKLEVASLQTLAEMLKSNTTVLQIDIDAEPKRLSVGTEEHMDYIRILENVRSLCSRNEKTQVDKSGSINGVHNHCNGYFTNSRKISLTCHSRPLIDVPMSNVSVSLNNKLDAKRKSCTRLRSPIPSPPTMSPSSSPSRSRFQVYRVAEVSPIKLPNTKPSQSASQPLTYSPKINFSISSTNNNTSVSISSLSYSNSQPSLCTVASSTPTLKQLPVSPRSRFQVSKIYEDPLVPFLNSHLPPIISKQDSKLTQSNDNIETELKNKNFSVDDKNKTINIPTSKIKLSSSSSAPLSTISKQTLSSDCDDNDMTLTKDSCISKFCSAASSVSLSESSKIHTKTLDNSFSQKNMEKMPWINNSTTVDKLLTLFHNPAAIFQRNTATERKKIPMPLSIQAEKPTCGLDETSQKQQNYPVTSQSSKNWIKLDGDIFNEDNSFYNKTNSVVITAAALKLEQSKSFFDAASRQFCDLSKQIFRQKLSVNKELNVPVTFFDESTVTEAKKENLDVDLTTFKDIKVSNIEKENFVEDVEKIASEQTLQDLNVVVDKTHVNNTVNRTIKDTLSNNIVEAEFDKK